MFENEMTASPPPEDPHHPIPPSGLTPPESRTEIGPPAWEERLVPAQEFADRLAIRRRTLGHRIREGSIPSPIRLHGRLYWPQSVVEQFIRGLAN